jgi:hypothetical protein
VTETGCVTGSGGDFVLTDLEAAGEPGLETRPTTDAYLLEGDDDELRDLVGQRVRVSGAADPAQVANVRVLRPMTRVRSDASQAPLAPHGSQAPQSGPKVGVEQQLRLTVRDLDVRAVNSTGERCELAGSEG